VQELGSTTIHMHTSPSAPSDSVYDDEFREIHLWDYVNIVLKRLYIAITIALTALLLGAVYSWTRTPKYQASARILLQKQGLNLTRISDTLDVTSAPSRDTEFLPTQIKLITSRPVLEEVLHKTGLDQKPAFKEVQDPISKLARMIEVQQIRNSLLVDILVERPDPQEAADIVNNVVTAFKLDSRKRRAGISDQSLIYLYEKSSELLDELDFATLNVQSFLITNKLTSFTQDYQLVLARIQGLNENLWRIEPVRFNLQAQLEAAEKALAEGRSIATLPAVMESAVIKELSIDLARMGIQHSELQSRLGENHPQLKSLESQRQALQEQIGIFAAAALESIRTQLAQVQKEALLLKSEIEKTQEQVRWFNQIQTEYELLTRVKSTAKINHGRILQRIEEIKINMLDTQGDNVFEISRASKPERRSSPNHAKNLAIAGFIGSLLAIGACFFIEYMDTSVKTMEEVRTLFGAEPLGMIPMAAQNGEPGQSSDLITAQDPKSNLAEAFRMVRSSLAHSNHGRPIRHLVVTSSLPREGKSISSVNIALSYAQAGKKVLLVDADMRKPRMHNVFGASNEVGLVDVLNMEESFSGLESCIEKTGFDNLFLLPAGPAPHNPAELIDSPRFEQLVRQLENAYDLIVFDSPPSAHLVDSLLIARQVDGMAIVVRLLNTPRQAVRYLANNLRSSNTNVLGIIVNNIDVPTNAQYGYYAYGGYGKYGGSAYYGAEEAKTAGKKGGTTPAGKA
jgi:succinoglycan biosynthesis transport protein ExoP